MKRFCSQLTFCNPDTILQQAVVEQDEQGMITDLFCLDENRPESARTVFFDGVISREIISLSERLPSNELSELNRKYHYINLSGTSFPEQRMPDDKLLLFDFGTSSLPEINQLLKKSFPFLSRYKLFEIITACVYNPLLVLDIKAELDLQVKSSLVLWQGADLVNKKITPQMSLSFL